MITLQHNQQYITKGGRRVQVQYRPDVVHAYKFWAVDAITGERWSCTTLENSTKITTRSGIS